MRETGLVLVRLLQKAHSVLKKTEKAVNVDEFQVFNPYKP